MHLLTIHPKIQRFARAALLAALVGACNGSIAQAQSTAAKKPGSSWSDRALDGVLQPYHDVDVATTEIGIIRKILVKPGDHVKAGQTIAELDTEMIEAQMRVKATEAASTAKLDQTKAELALQKMKYEKIASLVEGGKASLSELERSKSDLIIAEGRVANEEENAKVVAADLERFQTQINERMIVAPMDGIVTDVYKEVGEFVATNSPVIVRLIDVKTLRATFSVEENELSHIEVGKPIRVQLSAGGMIVQGLVEYVPPVADPETGWFMISVRIENQDRKIVGSRCQRLP